MRELGWILFFPDAKQSDMRCHGLGGGTFISPTAEFRGVVCDRPAKPQQPWLPRA